MVRLRQCTIQPYGTTNKRFNSIVVRLRPQKHNNTNKPYASFNSIVVRLRPREYLIPYVNRSSFNSIVVRLRLALRKRKIVRKIKFQFHSGAIKTMFLYAVRLTACSFNSIVVRLRHCFLSLLGKENTSFNSIVVRLRHAKTLKAQEQAKQFQFHSGAIKTHRRCINRCIAVVFQFHSGAIKTIF